MKQEKFEPKYNPIAATILFNKALAKGDYEGAREIAKICVESQERKTK